MSEGISGSSNGLLVVINGEVLLKVAALSSWGKLHLVRRYPSVDKHMHIYCGPLLL